MDEASVTQQYYIATRSSPSDDRPRVLKYGKMFAVFDRYGDIEPLGMGEQGIFSDGTRFLSELVLSLWNARPLLLSSTVKPDNLVFTADLANVDVSEIHDVIVERGTIHVLRSKFLWRGVCYEEFQIVNYGLVPVEIPLQLAIGADFADIFEVRGTLRERRGHRLEDRIDRNSILLSYEGLDKVLRQTRVQAYPDPVQISSAGMRFEISLRPKQSVLLQVVVSCNPRMSEPSVGYTRAMVAAESELKAASANLCRISSSNDRFNRWVRRSMADVEMMIVGNPEHDYPYAGVPWFSTIFGRDGIITALEMLWINPRIAMGVLQYLASTQATELNPEVEAEPGKILHEMRKGEMAALGEVPFARYYGTVDATPLFIMLAGAYYDYTGDLEFIRTLWPHIDLALQWIDNFGDVDGDGFVEYVRHGSKGLIQQGWKDSHDSIFHADGALAEAPIALCEVQGYVYAAKRAAAKISRVLGGQEREAALEAEAAELQNRFEEAFWCDDLSTYALALDGHKRACRVRSSNAGHCLFTEIASPENAQLVAHTLVSRDMFTGWGVRTVGSEEARYNPLSYHNGSVWPHDNALIAGGMAKYGLRQLAGQILMGLLDTSSAVDLHRLPELFCGLDRREGEGPTLYPVACSPQAWAAGAVFLLLQACLGLSIDGCKKYIVFDRPYLPEGIPQLWIMNLRVGDGGADLFLERHAGAVRIEVLEKQGEIEVIVK
ncbi:MAG TPA: amylo-alpha-1,6-glucosidase [Terriglobales bacterium]|nr:amylo-alpha-1,6-glucosidase [Terriglobales bacterium]